MRRWILKANGAGLDSLVMDEREAPEPGAGEVRVRVHAVSLNYRDQLFLNGMPGMTREDDLIPLSDGAGEIDAVGPGVEGWAVGDRVVGLYYGGWDDGPPKPGMGWGLGSPGEDGMLAEQVVLKADRVAAAPTTLTLAEAATLPCAALTAWTALNGDRPYGTRPVHDGDEVLVLGTGGVSLFALLLARAAGAEVIATSSQDAKRERLTALGAAETLNYATTPNWGEAVFARTGGVRRVVNAAGSGAMEQSIAAVGYGGEIALMGMLSSAEEPPDYIALMTKAAAIRGTTVGGGRAFADLAAAIDAHAIKPPIDSTFALADARDAYRAATSPTVFGKVVIDLDGA